MNIVAKRLREKAARGGVIPVHDAALTAGADEIERLDKLATERGAKIVHLRIELAAARAKTL